MITLNYYFSNSNGFLEPYELIISTGDAVDYLLYAFTVGEVNKEEVRKKVVDLGLATEEKVEGIGLEVFLEDLVYEDAENWNEYPENCFKDILTNAFENDAFEDYSYFKKWGGHLIKKKKEEKIC